jgi:hypothetical protein
MFRIVRDKVYVSSRSVKAGVHVISAGMRLERMESCPNTGVSFSPTWHENAGRYDK